MAFGSGIVAGGSLAALFLWKFETPPEPMTVRIAVPTETVFHVPEESAALGTARLHGELRRISEGPSGHTVTFRLVDWILGRDARLQLAIEDGNCTLEAAELAHCGEGHFFTRYTPMELTLPFIERPLIRVWARTPDGLHVDRDEDGAPRLVTATVDDLEKLLESEQLVRMPFIIMTSGQAIVSLEEQFTP